MFRFCPAGGQAQGLVPTTGIPDNMGSVMQNKPNKQRLLSIDALRGMDMFWIIGGEGLFTALFVLTGWQFWQTLAGQMEHSLWHGFTFYDLIFPLFIFLSGVSLGLSAKRLNGQPISQRMPVYKKAVRRLLLLMVLGIIYNHGWGTGMPASLDGIRYASVLGRIGFAWFVAAMLAWHFSLRGQAIIAGAILLLYWALLTLVTIDGYGGGVLTLEGSINVWFDKNLLPGITYSNLPVDPEGLLSNLPSVVNAMIGVFAGRMMVSLQSKQMVLLRNLLLAACACLAVGWLWHLVFPVNKSLWTSSFVLVSCGYSILLLALFYYTCDVLKWQKLAQPFMVIGVNAITIYMASSLVNWTYSTNSLFSGFISYSPDSWQPLLQVAALLMMQITFLAWMFRQKIFIKI